MEFETVGWFSWIYYGLGCGWMIITLPFLLMFAVAQENKHLCVTNQRVIYTSGVFGKEQHIIERSRVQDVRIRQVLGANWLGYGDLIIESAGRASPDRIAMLRDPRGARDALLST